jgi:tyrosinase
MKLSTILTAGLVGTVEGIKFMEVDALAAQGMFNLGLNVAINGLPSPKTCNLKNVAVRREWSVVKLFERMVSLTR